MGSLLKTSVVLGFLLLLPAVVHCTLRNPLPPPLRLRTVLVDYFKDKYCNYELGSVAHRDFSIVRTVTFPANTSDESETFQSAILQNYTGNVHSLVACQAKLPCNATGAFQISFNLSHIGVCSSAGPPGTQFDKFQLS